MKAEVTRPALLGAQRPGASELTARLGLADRVTHQVGNALELPFEDGNFGVVWTQNSGMNIADKERLYKGFFRVLQSGGLLALGEPMAGPVQPPIFPLMWAVDAATSFLRTPDEMRDMIEDAGFRARAWDDVTSQGGLPNNTGPTVGIQDIVMGDAMADIARSGQRNRDEQRIVNVRAVFDRP